MKKQLLYLAACLAFTTAPALAQQQKPAASPTQTNQKKLTPEQRAEEITTSMVKNLGLSGQQIAKVRQINLQSVQQMEQAKVKHRQNPRAMVNEAEQIGKSRLSLLKEVLTTAQFDKYQKKREQEMGITPTNPSAQPSGVQVPGNYQYGN